MKVSFLHILDMVRRIKLFARESTIFFIPFWLKKHAWQMHVIDLTGVEVP